MDWEHLALLCLHEAGRPNDVTNAMLEYADYCVDEGCSHVVTKRKKMRRTVNYKYSHYGEFARKNSFRYEMEE